MPRAPPTGLGMRAVRAVGLSFGIGAGLLGLEHGIFEALQLSVETPGPAISAIGPPCRPATARHACEPSFTLIPNFLAAGLLSIVVAAAVLTWTAAFPDRPHRFAILSALVVALFLVGGGFVTLIFGKIAVIAAGTDSHMAWWNAHLPQVAIGPLASLWPWVLLAYLAWDVSSWIIGTFANDGLLRITPAVTAMTPFLLALILLAAIAHDARVIRRDDA